MSLGCGTLASPSGFGTGTSAASSSNGKQHTLPKNPHHKSATKQDIEAHWTPGQSKTPTTLWGTIKATKLGGEEVLDSDPELWLQGDYWNVDSNIRKWTEHEVRRNAASASHDIHRHDQIQRLVLPPQPGVKRPMPPRFCVSGADTPGQCWLEAWGFDLGLRDRQAQPAPLWKPPTKLEQFRSVRSFDRNLARMVDHSRTLRKSASLPGNLAEAVTLRPEDIGGEAGEISSPDDAALERSGRPFGSRSCRGWDGFGHVVKREAAKMSNAIHSPSLRVHPDQYPYVNDQISPASVYTRKYRQGGPGALRKHETRSVRLPPQ